MGDFLKVLELFCGTKSISKVFQKKGHATFTIDNDAIHKPDLLIDILKFSINDLPKEFRKPDIIWASPPCTTFSVASIYHYWDSFCFSFRVPCNGFFIAGS